MADSDTDAEGSKELDELFERFGIEDDFALGFFAGVITGPEDITPAEWLPAFMGDNELDDEADTQLAVAVLSQLHGAVEIELRTAPAGLCPDADDEDGIAEFCKGYIRGAALHTTWMQNERGLALLVILTALAGELPAGEREPPAADEAWLENHRKQLAAYVGELFTMFETPRVPFVAGPKVNRNDTCPCGSGKKFKKCCLS